MSPIPPVVVPAMVAIRITAIRVGPIASGPRMDLVHAGTAGISQSLTLSARACEMQAQ